jgi:2-polyprenyl-3-methyl-5-hydroxy-6-metoxy-1,4-benzoquinol methylase
MKKTRIGDSLKEKSSQSALKGSLSAYLADQRLQVVSDYLRGDVLDIGCGYGRIVPRLPAGSAYVGLDSGPEIIQYLRKTYPKAEYYQLDLDTEPFQLKKFDTILMLAVVEHLTRLARSLPGLSTQAGY